MTRQSLAQQIACIEDLGLHFYRDCMRITNQFSTKYVLEKMLSHQKKHVDRLKAEINKSAGNVFLRLDLDPDFQKQMSNQFRREFDLEHLNFVEATKLALKMSQFYLNMYQQMKNENTNPEFEKIYDRLIQIKNDYIAELGAEYERLRYK